MYVQQITCNCVLAMSFFIDRNVCHIMNREKHFEKVSRDRKQNIQHVETSVASHHKQFKRPIKSIACKLRATCVRGFSHTDSRHHIDTALNPGSEQVNSIQSPHYINKKWLYLASCSVNQ